MQVMQNHSFFMSKALQLAKRGAMTTHPNPMVGCVLVIDGAIVAEGWHQQAGKAHAEVNAIQAAAEKGLNINGASAYVTLEPCAHIGRTGPCCEALAKAGIAQVVVAMRDPNPQVQGKGIAYLLKHNIEVIEGVLENEAQQLNRGFIKKMRQGLPFVQLKLGASLDGATAMSSGESQWITDAAARQDVQRMRAQVGAMITGSGTFYDDDPSLTVRPQDWTGDGYPLVEANIRQPLRVIVSSKLPDQRAQQSKIFNDGVATLWASQLASTYADFPENIQGLDLKRSDGKPDLEDLLKKLAALDINSVLVEAGAQLAGAFVEAGLVDELIIYYAATIMGSETRPMFQLPFKNMSERLQLEIKSVRQVGETVRMVAHFKARY